MADVAAVPLEDEQLPTREEAIELAARMEEVLRAGAVAESDAALASPLEEAALGNEFDGDTPGDESVNDALPTRRLTCFEMRSVGGELVGICDSATSPAVVGCVVRGDQKVAVALGPVTRLPRPRRGIAGPAPHRLRPPSRRISSSPTSVLR